MPRYVAFLRGVMPTNARMPALRAAFEAAGFTDVRTVLGSGNVVFDARAASGAALERRAEKAMAAELGRTFDPFVRPAAALQELVDSDPFARFRLPPAAKPIVTFLRGPAPATLELPIESDGARILAVRGEDVLSAYLPNPQGPGFMKLLERTFGRTITTRTLETVRKCARA
jgi:uncharacterized protein (DUF1697 family)